MWGLASAQEETSWSESPSAKLTEVAKGSREAHAHSNPHAWQLLFGIARNGNQTMKRAKECFWSRVWWDVLLEHLCYVFCRYIVLIHDAWTSLNHGHISEKNQSSIKHTDRQAVKWIHAKMSPTIRKLITPQHIQLTIGSNIRNWQ